MAVPNSRALAVVLGVGLTLAPVSMRAEEGAAKALDFAGAGWEIDGEGAVIEELDGKTALRLASGIAVYREIELLDGTIEFDLQVTDHRSFVFCYFRAESDGEREEIYFRPHKSGLPDAIQYTPAYKGRSQWQLYHDARSTAPASFPVGEWIPVKLVIAGDRVGVFVGGVAQPQLVAPLARAPKTGYLALRSFLPLGTPPGTLLASFANVVVRPGVVEDALPPVDMPARPAGSVARWELSSAFAPADGPVLEIPADIASGSWRAVTANDDGVVVLEPLVERPEGARRATVLARLRLTAEEASTKRLDLGFSDEVSVFLNGRLLLVDDESYSFNLPRRQGLLTRDQLSLFLPLRKGANELVLAVTDSFGGWGFSGLLLGAEDFRVDP